MSNNGQVISMDAVREHYRITNGGGLNKSRTLAGLIK